NTDRAAVALLEAGGWTHPTNGDVPTGGEFVDRYLAPLAALPSLKPHLKLNTRVTAVGRKGYDKVKTAGRSVQPFIIRASNGDGRQHRYEAKAVIDASG